MLALLGSDLFLRAFAGGSIAALTASPVGYFLVIRSQAFASEALLDICFAGATGAALAGFSPLTGMIVFSLLSAVSLGALGDRVRGRSIEIGMVLSAALGLGVLFLSMYARTSGAHATAGVAILFGSIMSVREADIVRVAIAGAVALLSLGVMYRPLLFASIDPAGAAARGVPLRGLSIGFLMVVALAAAACTLVVGVLLATALLIAPAAAAVRLARSPFGSLLLSVCFGVAVLWAGLLLSFGGHWYHPPVGFSVTTCAAALYMVAVLATRQRRARVPAPLEHPDREVRSDDHARVR